MMMNVLLIVSTLLVQVSSFGVLAPTGGASQRWTLVTRYDSESAEVEAVAEVESAEVESPEAAVETTSVSSSGPEWERKWKVDDSFITTESGLKYKDIVVGEGESPEEEGAVSIFYQFHFDDFTNIKSTDEGMLYFNSRANNPKQEPMTIQYGKAEIIPGWQEGMATMKPNGKRIVIVPPELGYGNKELPAIGYAPNQLPVIPANSYLKFEIEMVNVDNSALTKFRYKVPKPSSIFDQRWFK